MELQNRNANASMQKALTMVQQKKLSLAALKAKSQTLTNASPNEIMSILDKDLEQALSQLQQAETDLTQVLIGRTDQAYMEEKVEVLQQLAMKFTELKRLCLVLASQDDIRL